MLAGGFASTPGHGNNTAITHSDQREAGDKGRQCREGKDEDGRRERRGRKEDDEHAGREKFRMFSLQLLRAT